MTGLNELLEQGKMTWIEQEHGCVRGAGGNRDGTLEDGFEEYKCQMTTSRGDQRPAGGVWRGLINNPRTGSVALGDLGDSSGLASIVDIEGESLKGR